ncbi:MAG: PQQ-binding-like beta-propeller repeat protein [Planctomycetaceae bacterium]|nr:PQQ-binding-like beta-propeller repeat protein [Planctomycetaceae bacterium]
MAVLVMGLGSWSVSAQPFRTDDIRSDQFGPIALVPVPREIEKALEEVEQQLRQQQYPAAVGLLQTILETSEDYLLEPRDGSRATSSVKQRALAMLRALPADGRQAYQLQYDAQAGQLWSRYQESADPAFVVQIARCYPTTSSGPLALGALAGLDFDRSQPLSAARWWDDLAAQEATSPHRLERIVAWSVAGRPARGRELLAELAQTPQATWQLAGQRVSGGAIAKAFTDWSTARFPEPGLKPQRPVADWTMFRGDAQRNGVALPAGPIGGPAWSVETLTPATSLASLLADEPNEVGGGWADLVTRIEEQLALDDKVRLPGFHPLVVGDTAVFRTMETLEAVDLRTGQLRWRTPVSYSQLHQLSAAAGELTADERGRWINRRAGEVVQRLYRDQTAGTLSCDGEWVYAVEASPVADRADLLGGILPPPTVANKLTAYDLRTGKLVWELGGRRTEAGGQFSGDFFQGPPLVVGDVFYCIAEINSEQRLLQFRRQRSPPGATLEWSQVLAAPQTPPLGWSPQRQMCGQTPSLAGDILICPTTAGLVVAVDPLRRLLLWGYRYASHKVPSDEQRSPFFASQPDRDVRPILDEDDGYWLDTAPTISGTRVLLTPRDSMELHALDLLTGELLWKQPRGEGLYVAGIDGPRALIVGRQAMEARNIADGSLVWEQPIPSPAGRGLMLAGRYLLPVEPGEILAVEPATGRLAARAKFPDGGLAGNLAAARGMLVSQSVREVSAFRSLSDIESRIAEALGNRADDAEALALRGEVRLFRGDEAGGVADLRRSLAAQPNRHASRILAGVLIDGLKRDFNRYQSLIDEIDRVTVDPELRAEFLQLVADGLERQGNRVAAFGQYLKLAGLTERSTELVRVDAALAARGDRVVRGRAWATYQAATSAERTQIDQMIRQHLERSLSGPESLERDARFLQFFDGHPLTDVVRRRFIERLPPDRQPERLHELRRLADSRTPQQAAFAASQLARWHLDRNEFATARPWLLKLSIDYPAEPIGNLGSASSLLQRWATEFGDRWVLTAPTWPTGEIEPERRPAPETSLRRIVRMEIVGPVGPEHRDWTFELHDDVELSVVARDAAGRSQWTVALPDELLEVVPRDRQPAAAPRAFCAGTLLAISFGPAFAVLETPPGSRTANVLWHRALIPPEGRLQMIQSETLNTGRRRTYVGDRQHGQPFGQLLGLTADQLVYHLGSRVIAVDPLTGQTVWTRNDAPRRAEGTVDAQVVTVFDTDKQQAQVLRASDGVELARRDLPNPHDWLWFHGDRLATLRVRRGELLAELLELSSGRTVWRQALPLTSRCTVVDQQEILCLEPQGRLSSLSVETGNVNWELQAAAVERLGFLWAVRNGSGYCVVAGNPSPLTPDNGHIRPYDGTQTPFAGVAFQIDPAQQKVTWKVDVPATAFEVTQPATAPLLAFVGKVVPPPEQPNGVFPPPAQLSALFIDRRDGTVVYQTTESHAPGLFRWELSGEHQTLTAHFASWLIEFAVTE